MKKKLSLVLATLMLFPWPVIAYFLAAWLGRPAGAGRYDRVGRYGSVRREDTQAVLDVVANAEDPNALEGFWVGTGASD